MKHLKFLFVFSVLLIYSCSDDFSETSPAKDLPIEVEKRQFTMNGFQPISTCEAANLTYYIEDCFEGTPYADAIPASMQMYNDAPTSLFFTQVYTDDADLVFSCTTLGKCGRAQAAFPVLNHELVNDPLGPPTYFDSGGSIGSEIQISIGEWDEGECECALVELGQCFFMHTVMHEVGHTLGLYHNSVIKEIELNEISTLIPNTVDGAQMTDDHYDAGSIMNAGNFNLANGTWCDPSCEFNDNDILALQSLYPAPEILGDEEICNMTSYIYCLPEGLVGSWMPREIKWVPGSSPTSPAQSNCFAYSWTEPGEYTISVNVCGLTYTKVITVLDCF